MQRKVIDANLKRSQGMAKCMHLNIRQVLISLLIIFATWLWTTQDKMLNRDSLLNNNCTRLWVHAPSTVIPGETFEFQVQAWDDWERLSASYTGKIEFFLESYNITTLEEMTGQDAWILPSEYRFTGTSFDQGLIPPYKISAVDGLDHGKHSFQASINEEGIHYIHVIDDQGHHSASNPIIVHDNARYERLFWGDIHGHSGLCDGSGYLNDMWGFARNVALLDFAAITTHDDWTDYYGTGGFLASSAWELAKKTANLWHDPGRFVTLVAWEWTSQLKGYGHMCVYFRGDDGPMFSSSYPEYESQDKLWTALYDWKQQVEDGNDVITIPHHTAFGSSHMWFDWSYYDPEFVPLVEVYSAHGSSERIHDNRSIAAGEATIHGHHVQDALAMGYKLGLMASSDTHDGRLGHPILHTDANNRFQYPYTMIGLQGGGFRFAETEVGGLVGIFARELNRECIFDALKNRACFGTTHVCRPYIKFSINGLETGKNHSTIYLDGNNLTRTINIFVAAEGNTQISNITIVKNKVDFFSIIPDRRVYRVNFTDSTDLTGMNYSFGIEKNGLYYINDHAHVPLHEF
ncbi:MAG: DUF3604 domain-containing protein, partial [Promethearchaeota archaeon]